MARTLKMSDFFGKLLNKIWLGDVVNIQYVSNFLKIDHVNDLKRGKNYASFSIFSSLLKCAHFSFQRDTVTSSRLNEYFVSNRVNHK